MARIATVYGPVGFVDQEEGDLPKVRIRSQWAEIATMINTAIESGNALVGPGGAVHHLTEEHLSEDQVEALSKALSESSDGDLYLVPEQTVGV